MKPVIKYSQLEKEEEGCPSLSQDDKRPQQQRTKMKVGSGLTYLIIVLSLFFTTVQGLINDPVAQRTFIMDYQPGVIFEHTSFDMSILDGTSLVQADDVATYFLAKESSRSLYGYQFVRANHSQQVFEIIQPKIQLPGYAMYGMCIQNGSLDYLIGVEVASGEIRVLRTVLTTDDVDPTLQMAVVNDYKVVDKNETLILSGNLYIHCQYDQSFKGVNTYSIGILGYYFHPNAISNYFYAKFSTKYNLTEYFVQSQNLYTMEIPRKIYMDVENRRVYLAIEVNKNRYNEMTVYAPGAQPGVDNSNVAIICYEWTHGTRRWISMLGSSIYSDVFVDLSQYSNNIYVVVNSVTSIYATNSSQTDIMYYKLRTENGVVEVNKVLGSPGDDKALSMGVSFNGVYIYALINGPFNPHRDNTKQWKTIGNFTNLAMIHLDFTDQILDIEAQDYSNLNSSNYLGTYPMKFFLIRSNMTKQNWIFVSHRSNLVVDRTGGIQVTYYQNITAPFQQTFGCSGIGCSNCSAKVLSYCFQCAKGYQLFQHSCNQDTCPLYTYPKTAKNWTTQGYCNSCHYSCKTCNGPRDDQCSACCMNGVCGPTYNRVPTLGKCLCPDNTAEVNGICNFQCTQGFSSRLDQKCMTKCPTNSFPLAQYDGAVAQEMTQFDPSQAGACEKYSNHLVFTKLSQGLALPGPEAQKSMIDEFMIAFWVMPTDLNTFSYLVNAFNRAQIIAQSSNSQLQYKFVTGPDDSVNFVQPLPVSPSSNMVLQFSAWNYVAVSQRVQKTLTQQFYEIQVGIAKGNFGTIVNAGYTANTIKVVRYSGFNNAIYIGGQSDLSSSTSFSGYIKEVQVYTNFRGLAQMQSQFSRAMRLYSFDDRSLIAYWKLTETYTSADKSYDINDFSYNMNSISYSKVSNPAYPTFTLDLSKTINLCYIHDIQNCLTLDYSRMPPIATSSRNYIRMPTLDLREYSRFTGIGNLQRQQDDMIFYVPQNLNCSQRNMILAKMNYTYDKAKWEVKDDTYNPMYLLEGYHYQQCYYIAKMQVVFNLAQVYVAYRPRTVDPSNSNIYNRSDNYIRFMTGFGDQGYGDVLRLARDCDNPRGSETEFARSNDPGYDRVGVTASFNLTGTFYFCWFPMFTNDYLNYPIYESIHNLYWQIQYEPAIKSTFRTTATMNQDMVIMQTSGTFIDGDLITMAWQGLSYSDCNPKNFMGATYTYNHSSWPGIWMGYDTGIHGIVNTNMDQLQICWKPASNGAPSVYIRVKLDDGSSYSMRNFQYLNISNQRAPELVSFDPPYGSSIILQTERVIKFNFKAQQVMPSRKDPSNLGMIKIFRGAVKADGTYVKIENSVLWQNLQLNELTLPDPFQQGDLICTQTGQCSIILSQSSNRMKAGEIYYLTFYPFSFMTQYKGSKYYLFGNNLTYGVPAYDHLFTCRSFDVYSSDQLINGQTVVVHGLDLRQKLINAKYSAGSVTQEIFYTKAINLRLQVFNTAQVQCIANRPTATVAMEDVFDTYFIIRNLQLRECNSGQLFADIEFLRGIRDDNADYSYMKREDIYNIQIGSIGCDPSCKVCNGTLDSNCMICSNSSYNLFMGKCFPDCPTQAAYVDSYTIIYQNLEMTQAICTANCPFGKYSNALRDCVQCNADCQTCHSSTIASCLTCNPIKYIFNGMCVTQCPQPHHVNNFTDYLCHTVSEPVYLKVAILPLGFMTAIPKDKTVYLKAEINNTGGGNITSILWQQMQPSGIQIFSQDPDGTHNVSYSMVRLDNNVLMKLGKRQSAQVNVTVTNSFGDIAYDIYEFFLNDSPFVGTMSLSVAGSPTRLVYNAVDDLMRLNLTNWYDSPDDSSQMLRMKIHLITKIQVGQTVQYQQFTVADLVQNSTLYFRIPPIFVDTRFQSIVNNPYLSMQPGYGLANVTYCVSAIDQFNAITTKCADLMGFNNKMSFLNDYTQLLNYVSGLQFGANITNILYASAMIYQSIQKPMRPNSQPYICTGDVHCGFNGDCIIKSATPRCECYQGYFGTYCDFNAKELPKLRQISSNILDDTLAYVNSKALTEFDIEIIGNVVRSLLNHPDTVEDINYFKVLRLLETLSNADLYAHQPYDTNITNIIFEAYGNAQLKIAHSNKVRLAMSDTILLGAGMNLLNSKNSFTLATNSTQLKIQNSNAAYYNLSRANGLIRGVMSPRQLDNFMLSKNATQMYQEWGRRWEASFSQFCKCTMYKMDPLKANYTFRHTAFELMLMHRRPSQVNGTIYIRSKDSYWQFPPDLFALQNGVASRYHEINFKLVKNIMHPFQFEPTPGAFLESNVTTIEAFSLNSVSISLELPATSPNYIQYKEPYNSTRGYGDEWLRCMSWDDKKHAFTNDNSCIFSLLWQVIPCSDCDAYNQMNTTISLCRCKSIKSHITVTAFQVNASTWGIGMKNSIYTDFFAMQYWQQSFGFLAMLVGMIILSVGQVMIWLLDGRLRRNLVIRLREKARNFELKHSAEMMREEGLFLRVDIRKKFVMESATSAAQVAVASTKKVFQEGIETAGGPGEEQKEDMPLIVQDEQTKKKERLRRRKVTLAMKKKVFEDDEDEDDSDESGDEELIKQLKLTNKEGAENDEEIQKQLQNIRKIQEEKKKREEEADGLLTTEKFDEERDMSVLNEKQKEQYERHQKIYQKLYAQKQMHELYHELLLVTLDQVEGMTQNEFRKQIMGLYRKLPIIYQEDVKRYLLDIKAQLYSTDDELVKSMKDVFDDMREERERSLFKLKHMVIHGSVILSLIFVTSILSPRHVRWTIFICNVAMLFYICAVYFNNTQNPLVVPDFNTSASSLAAGQLWISFIAPIGSMIGMYVVSMFLKMPNNQFVNVVALRQLEVAVIEYKREQKMRFFMGYCIVGGIMGFICWYIVNFTATFGWKVSWIWYYTGVMSAFMQFFIYDPILSLFHWIVYRRSKKAGRICQIARSMSQGHNEAYDMSSDDEETLRKKEIELRKKQPQRKKKATKKKKKTGMFGETHGTGFFGEGGHQQQPAEEENQENAVQEFNGDPVVLGQVDSGSGDPKGKSSGHDTAEDALNGEGSSGNNKGQR